MDKRTDAAQFKMGMRSLAGAVSIITSNHEGRLFGMTATAVCSACADPPTVLVCVNQSTTTHEAIDKARVFCVNVLRHEDRELSSLFSGLHTSQMRGEARFRMVEKQDPVRFRKLAAAAERAAAERVSLYEQLSHLTIPTRPTPPDDRS